MRASGASRSQSSSDAKVLDQQCGMEVSLSLMTALLHGANIVHDVGFMDSGLQGSLQLQVIANDTIGWLRAATAGVPVNEETLALDVIYELGPTGNYLAHEHTLRHYRLPYYSKLADKGAHSQWLERGATTMEERAAQQVDEILDSESLASARAIVERAGDDLFVISAPGGFTIEYLTTQRGKTQALMDLLERPDFCHSVMEKALAVSIQNALAQHSTEFY